MANRHMQEIPQLGDAERQGLQRRRKPAQALALRARFVLLCDEGRSDTAVAQALRVTTAPWASGADSSVARGCDGLLDEARPGTPRKISVEDVERVVVRTLESVPRGPRCGAPAPWPPAAA